ncbi:uncharacterized protein BX663DRAFT_451708 [Cokeromyces recurvatus]|uniref:uncharacterized protein n=1 Tax=Cokeromyces recurvatus TaxID=90255 RepID=UPI00221E3AF4|nr:uncharacterized protein BX663DRAFT_451708 [Cokeromyces recurvatus]KAI7904130.1 hypothetical protein BX663DRAFT_451708 [Cokeromyces recurvatus]
MSSLSSSSIQFWNDICTKAFNNDPDANDFVLFFEGCKIPQHDDTGLILYSWTTLREDYQQKLQQLGCAIQQSKPDELQFTLSSEELTLLFNEKSKIRTKWHSNRQKALKEHLNKLLQQPLTLLTLNSKHRLALVKQFVEDYGSDLGSVPFLRGLTGLLKYQLEHPQSIAEWSMNEFLLTQNNEDAMDAYIRLLRGVLCMQNIYQDDINDTVAIDIDTVCEQPESILIWRMSPELDDKLIRDILKSLPNIKDVQKHGYKVTDIPRKQSTSEHQTLFQWVYEIFSYCLSFLHK